MREKLEVFICENCGYEDSSFIPMSLESKIKCPGCKIAVNRNIVEINNEVYTQKTIELDQLDILYRHGILGFVVYFAQFIAIILLIAKQIILKMEYFLNLDVVICIIDIVLALGIAFTAGHILTAPAVGFFLITSTIKLYNDIFKKVV